MRLHLSCICFLFRSAVCSPGGGGAGTNREGSELQEDYRPVVPRADSKATPQSLEDVTDVDGLPVGWNSEDGQYTLYSVASCSV